MNNIDTCSVFSGNWMAFLKGAYWFCLNLIKCNVFNIQYLATQAIYSEMCACVPACVRACAVYGIHAQTHIG